MLTPGSEVAIEFQSAGLPQQTLQSAIENCTRQLEAGGIKVVAGAPLKFVGEVRVIKQIDVQLQFTPFGRAAFGQEPQTITLPLKQEELRIKLVDTAGTEYWNLTSTASSGLPRGMIKVPAGQTPDGYVQKLSADNLERSLTEFFSHPSLPCLVFPQPEKISRVAISDKTLLDSSPNCAPAQANKTRTTRSRRPSSPPRVARLKKSPRRSWSPTARPNRKCPSDRAGQSVDRWFRSAPPEVRRPGTAAMSARRYVDLLAGPPEEFLKQVRWLPATKRPSIGSRWGRR